jgi:hypothetical protein
MLTLERSDVVNWAVGRWQAEVANRPLQNIHRRSLDTTWRQIIRYFGGDALILCGPAHDELLSLSAAESLGTNPAPDMPLDGHATADPQLGNADDKFIEALIWCSASQDFQEGGQAREGWLKICKPLIDGALSAGKSQ